MPNGLRHSPEFGEPEDHAAIRCDFMAGSFAGSGPREAKRQLFEAHLAPWIGRLWRQHLCRVPLRLTSYNPFDPRDDAMRG